MNRDPEIKEDNRVQRRKRYYIRHREALLEKARARSERFKSSTLSVEAKEDYRRRHREAQARYRAANKTKIQLDNMIYRASQKERKEQARLMAQSVSVAGQVTPIL